MSERFEANQAIKTGGLIRFDTYILRGRSQQRVVVGEIPYGLR